MSTSLNWKSWWTIFFLVFIFSPELEANAGREPIMKVLINNDNKIRFRADGEKFLFVNGIYPTQKRIKSIELTYKNGQASYSISKKKENRFDLPNNFNLIIKNNDSRGTWFQNRRYAGKISVFLNNEKLYVINHIKLEKYLQSVVGSEMPKEFPLAALQAQAIAARTYALKLLRKNSLYDVKASQDSQVYLGLEAETPQIKKAVRSTNSLALFYKGKLIDAVFHSSSGGRTEASGQVWKYQLPYLISVSDYDQNGSKYKWKNKFSSANLVDKFNDLGGVNGIQIVAKSSTNRVKKLLIYGPKGKKSISGKSFRNLFNLNSTKFAVDFVFDPIKNQDDLMINQKDYSIPPLPPIPERYFLSITGYGAGHGVGMSQWGAKSMADNGANFRKILRHYYTGVKIKAY